MEPRPLQTSEKKTEFSQEITTTVLSLAENTVFISKDPIIPSNSTFILLWKSRFCACVLWGDGSVRMLSNFFNPDRNYTDLCGCSQSPATTALTERRA